MDVADKQIRFYWFFSSLVDRREARYRGPHYLTKIDAARRSPPPV